MLIVDAQVHIWSGGTPLGAHRQVSNYSADELLREMDEAGVDAALIHPPGWDPHSHEVAVEAARAHPDKFAILGYLPLDRAESRAAIDSWTNQPGVLGLRYALVRPEQRTWHEDGTMDWLWPAAERAGLPVALMATRFFPLLAQIAERHPGLRLIVDHLGYVSGVRTMPRSDPIGSSGAPISRGCPVATVNASRCLPRNCPGSRATIWSV